jgi:hypothetical protein
MKYDLSKPMELNRFKARLTMLEKSKKVIELKEVKPIRSLSQNAYLHVCIALFGIEFGYHLEDAKQLLKRSCSFMHYLDAESNMHTVKTRELDTKQLTDFIDYIRTFSSMQGCYIPSPEEYIENRTYIDNAIASNKQYL